MKYIITKAYNQGDWFNKDVALIPITDKLKEKLKPIKDFIFSVPTELFKYVEVRQYNFSRVVFVDSTLIEDLEEHELNNDITTVEAWVVYDGGEDSEVEISDINNLRPIEGEVERVDAYCVVDCSGVTFKANNHYGDGEEMWTDPIPFDLILNF